MNLFVLPASRSPYKPVLSRRQQLLTAVCSALPVVIIVAVSFFWIAWSAQGYRHGMPLDATPLAWPPQAVALLNRSDSRPSYDDVRLVRSPVFFSLPSPLGFSAPLQVYPAMTTAPVLEADLPLFLVSGATLEPAGFGQSSRSLAELIGLERKLPLPEMPDAFSIHQIPEVAAQSTYSTFWLDRPGEPPPAINGPDMTGENPGAIPWEAIFFLCLDEQGFVQRLLAEKPAPTARVNESLLRSLRATFFPGAPANECHRLVVRYLPALKQAEHSGP